MWTGDLLMPRLSKQDILPLEPLRRPQKATPEDEADSLLGEGTVDVDVSDTMAAYTQAITKYTK